MPIKRLQQRAKFPTIGKLRKGGEKTATGFGKELDYWRFVPNNGIFGLGAAFNRIFGDKPKHIEVVLPYDTTDECFDCWQEQWSASSLLHRCDGETTVLVQVNGEYQQITKPCPGGCKEVGRLSVIIPALCRKIGYIGSVTMETHSLHDIMNISAALMAYEDMRGNLKGGSFILSRYPDMISTPNKKTGKRARREKWLVRLTPTANWLDDAQYLPPQQELEALPTNVDINTGELIEHEMNEPVRQGNIKALHAQGKRVYGSNWDKKRAEIGAHKGYKSSKDWSFDYIEYVIKKLSAMPNHVEPEQEPIQGELIVDDERATTGYEEPDF